MFKRLYQIVAWLALANLFAVAGLVGYLVASGRLDAERVDQIAMVLRGEFPEPQTAETQPAMAEAPPQTSREELKELQARKRFYELIAERQQRELADRSALNQSIQMDVNRQLENIEAKEQEFEQNKKETTELLAEDGFKESLEIFSSMDPKLAKEVLMDRKDADVVRVFMEMDEIRRKKIINTCKTAEEQDWISRVLTQMVALDKVVPDEDEQVATAGPGATAQ